MSNNKPIINGVRDIQNQANFEKHGSTDEGTPLMPYSVILNSGTQKLKSK